jgi:3-methyladenine DNA glycosylase AlkD
MEEIISDLIKSIESLQDPKRKELAKTYAPTSMKVIGLTGPNEKIIVKELISTTKNLSIVDKINLAIQLVETKIFECQHIAYVYLNKNKKVLAALTKGDIEKLAKYLDNWVSVDTFSVFIYGVAWRLGIINEDAVKNLLKSNDYWQRRIAVVSTVPLNQKSQGGTGDAKRTLEICSLVVNDHKDMVVKALSWALRELSKREKTLVKEFLNRNRNHLHKKVIREVEHKLNFGTKN